MTGLAEELPLAPGRTVVELGAGTGKFTRLLALTGARVTAVEPVAELRGRLADRLPAVRAVDGAAECTGLPAGCADAVVAADSWHWFRQPAALAEAERLLRPGGALALVWNTVRECGAWPGLLGVFRSHAPAGPGPGDGWRRLLAERPGWGPVRERAVDNRHTATEAEVAERLLAEPAALGLDGAGRLRLRAAVEAALRQVPRAAEPGPPEAQGAGPERVEVPCTTGVHWTRWRGDL